MIVINANVNNCHVKVSYKGEVREENLISFMLQEMEEGTLKERVVRIPYC